jgi:type VI secretion system secreted protein VgrG
MADDPKLEGVHIQFASGFEMEEPLVLRGVWGRERLGRLFEFDLLLSREAGPLTEDELDSLLKAPCAIALGKRPGDVVHGLLERIELIDSARSVAARYLARVVPNVWLLTLSRTSRVYQNTSIPDLVRAVLGLYGMKEREHFEVRVGRAVKSPVREYIVQYQESDWDFLQRWLEHEGFFYWFQHGEKGEKLIVADENEDATAIEDPKAISYRERNNLSTGGAATIWDYGLVQRRIPARVALVDYNYRQPSAPLYASETVDEKRGFGTVFSYGEHFKDAKVGKAMAALRAERFAAERRTYHGRTDCARFRVGHSFELENHFDAAHDGEYLITAVEHRVGWPVHAEGGAEGSQRYTARFEAIPFDVPFRPPRRTPWPRVHGVIHALVDGDTSGDYAELDEQGRYKVRMPYDMAGKKGMKASRWIRMAQPYAGQGYGTHHPLHKGIEVLVAHVDGDPDRPIILSAVPNPRTTSPSTSANATQSVTQTASGIRIEMEDLQS